MPLALVGTGVVGGAAVVGASVVGGAGVVETVVRVVEVDEAVVGVVGAGVGEAVVIVVVLGAGVTTGGGGAGVGATVGAGGGVNGGGVKGCGLVVAVEGTGVLAGGGLGARVYVGPSCDDPGSVKSEPDSASVWPLPLAPVAGLEKSGFEPPEPEPPEGRPLEPPPLPLPMLPMLPDPGGSCAETEENTVDIATRTMTMRATKRVVKYTRDMMCFVKKLFFFFVSEGKPFFFFGEFL